jgi:hypothetical protein
LIYGNNSETCEEISGYREWCEKEGEMHVFFTISANLRRQSRRYRYFTLDKSLQNHIIMSIIYVHNINSG